MSIIDVSIFISKSMRRYPPIFTRSREFVYNDLNNFHILTILKNSAILTFSIINHLNNLNNLYFFNDVLWTSYSNLETDVKQSCFVSLSNDLFNYI
jgi:hypothetical protein